jgi:hypothetical protein
MAAHYLRILWITSVLGTALAVRRAQETSMAKKTLKKSAKKASKKAVKKAAKKSTGSKSTRKVTKRARKAAKRELIDTGTDKRYVRRAASGEFKESDDVSRSLRADRRTKATRKVKSGQGDKGDR